MTNRWSVYWDGIDKVWRTESSRWADLGREDIEGHPTWREALDYANARAAEDAVVMPEPIEVP